MKVDVVFLPKDLTERHIRDRAVVVFDVLRATTTMTAALASGAREIHVFSSLDAARSAAEAHAGSRLLCGEVRCLPPEGFDLGNSPGTYVTDVVQGKTLFMSTTNGTRAIAAARGARKLFVAALVNARAATDALIRTGLDVTLLCAGTDGALAVEDIVGAGAVVLELSTQAKAEESANATIAAALFSACRDDLPRHLRQTTGARNVIAAGLEADVPFAAMLNAFGVVGEIDPQNLVVGKSLS
jgi:2-phosphosulfolactate phosphatase